MSEQGSKPDSNRLINEDTKAMIRMVREQFIPNKVVILRGSKEQSDKITILAPFTKFHTPMNDKATAHICVDHNCKLPITNLKQMASMINPFPDLITLSYPELISWIIPSTVFLRLMNVKYTDIYKILFTISVFRVMCVMHDLLN